MPRLFIGNFDFEHRLAEPGRQLPARLERINAELATAWLAIADDADYVWTPQRIDPDFFEQAAADGLPRVTPILSFEDVPKSVECIPWGWTDDIRRLCDKHGWIRNDPPLKAVRDTNSRRFSTGLEQEWQVGLEGSGPATSLQEIERLVERCGSGSRWVIKAEFGMSGRERILGCGAPTNADRHWIESRLRLSGVVFFEPWVERLAEVGIQIDIPRTGAPQLVGVVPLLSDTNGQYRGSWFAPPADDPDLIPLSAWDDAVEVGLRAAARAREVSYFGPFGIDAMRYRATDGAIRTRPMQDINARWTMGRLSLGWRRLLQAGEAGCWQHGRSDQTIAGSAKRMIGTSPLFIGDRPSDRVSIILVT